MKKLIIIFLLLGTIVLNAQTTYYVSETAGGDTLTLTEANVLTPNAGDQFLFKRGDTFTGALVVKNSGTSGSPIIYGAYGTGADPIITGFTSVTAWTDQGSNIWESTSAVSTLDSLNIVLINGANIPMGREPELGIYYTVDSHSGNTSITSSSLTGTPDWTGAEVVTRKERWIWQRAEITSQSTSTINYTDVYANVFSPQDDWGFFIQKDIGTLDTQNEWYYNPSTKKISVYSTTEPTNVKIPTVERLFSIGSRSYITVQNIALEGANTDAINVLGGDYVTIQDCDISYIGASAIRYNYSDYLTVNNNNINSVNYHGTYNAGYSSYDTITNNTIDSSSMIIGIDNGVYSGNSINSNGNYSFIAYNKISNSGYHGILLSGRTGATIKNNFINYSLMNRSDGGGIYTAGTHVNSVVDGNIVLNTVGETDATNGGISLANGIYLDMPTKGLKLQNNTVAYSDEFGIFINKRGQRDTVVNNIVFDNGIGAFGISDFSTTIAAGDTTRDMYIKNNEFIAVDVIQQAMKFESGLNSIPEWISYMDSNYIDRPINQGDIIYASQPSTWGTAYLMTLSEWQTFSGKDANSTVSPYEVSAESEMILVYNSETTSQSQSLTGLYKWKDLDGTLYSESITLTSFASKILFVTTTPITPAPTSDSGLHYNTTTGKFFGLN